MASKYIHVHVHVHLHVHTRIFMHSVHVKINVSAGVYFVGYSSPCVYIFSICFLSSINHKFAIIIHVHVGTWFPCMYMCKMYNVHACTKCTVMQNTIANVDVYTSLVLSPWRSDTLYSLSRAPPTQPLRVQRSSLRGQPDLSSS